MAQVVGQHYLVPEARTMPLLMIAVNARRDGPERVIRGAVDGQP